jgi:trehalose 6-phosphate synthase
MSATDQIGLPVVVLSHRGPLSFQHEHDGRRASRGAGGLVTALLGMAGQLPDCVWVCAAATTEDAAVSREYDGGVFEVALQPELRLLPRNESAGPGAPSLQVQMVEVDEQAHQDFYAVIANPLLWFIQHGLYGVGLAPELTAREHDAFEHGYVAVNERFADAVSDRVAAAGGQALVMLHDYHFYLVAGRVRERHPDVVLSHFVHIPWPGPDAWRILPPPMRERLLWGLLGNDVVGFHTESFARNFLLCAQELLGLPVDLKTMTIRVGEREVAARTYPISVDVGSLEELAASPAVDEQAAALTETLLSDGRQLILRVDRTDPSKNIVRGFHAFGTMLADHPELVGRVTFLAILQPSRQDVAEYADYLAAIGAAVAEINAAYAREDYQPVDLRLQENLPLAVAAYRVCDVLLVNAVADGMNLVAKEAVLVNTRDGVLALSENTGAHQELGAFAVTLYPFDIQQQADALHEALTMDPELRRARREAAAGVVRESDVTKWLSTQLADLGPRIG